MYILKNKAYMPHISKQIPNSHKIQVKEYFFCSIFLVKAAQKTLLLFLLLLFLTGAQRDATCLLYFVPTLNILPLSQNLWARL